MTPVGREQATGVEDEQHRSDHPQPVQLRGQGTDREHQQEEQPRRCAQDGTHGHVSDHREGQQLLPRRPDLDLGTHLRAHGHTHRNKSHAVTVRNRQLPRIVTGVPDVEDVLNAVRATDWTQWDVPWADYLWAYEPTSVVPAFEALAAVRTKDDARQAYHRFLNAVAHDHSGTPYPAIVEGVRHLVALIPHLESWATETAVSALVECYLFTADEVAARSVDGMSHDLTEVHRLAVTIRPLLNRLAADHDHPARAAATDLLNTIEDIPPTPRSHG